jgi:MFS family permease
VSTPRWAPRRFAESGATAASGLLFGYSIAAINTALSPMQTDLDLSAAETGFVVSAVAGGALLGAVMAGILMGLVGPRHALLVAGAIAGLGSVATVVVESCGSMVAARAAIGAGVGIASVATPVFVADRADPHRRGILLTSYQLSITVGILVALVVGWAVIGHASWRWITGLNALPAVVVMLGAALSAKDGPVQAVIPTSTGAGAAPPTEDQAAAASRRDAGTAARSAALVAIAAALMNALTGVGLVMYYSTEIFAAVGGGGQSPVFLSVLVGAANVVASVVAVPLIARVDRRPLLICGLVGMAASLMIMAISLQVSGSGYAAALAVTGTVAYMAFFAISAGPLAWLVVSEVAPPRYRNVVTSSAIAANWTCNLILAVLFPILVGSPPDSRIAAMCCAGFVLASLGFAAFVWRYVPETRGLTLPQIQSRFLARVVRR